MLIIHHRRNTTALLLQTEPQWGVEIDVRSYGSQIVVHHDPFVDAITLPEWLDSYKHSLLILNTKEEGLESDLLKLMDEHDINDFFFLDQSFPFLLKTVQSGEPRCAVRVSEFESIDTALALTGLAKWVWVDTFSSFPLDLKGYSQLKEAGFKLCLVSPELHSEPYDKVISMQVHMQELGIVMDAVCTKKPSLWINH